jgi:short subunit fatty acids transporter
MAQVIAGVLALVIPVLDTASLAAAIIMAAALLFTLLLVARASTPPTAPLRAIATSVRHRAEETAFLRLRDPDAAGRPRPRAPGRQRGCV